MTKKTVFLALVALAALSLAPLIARLIHAERDEKPASLKELLPAFLSAEPGEREDFIRRFKKIKADPVAVVRAFEEADRSAPEKGKLAEAVVKAGGRDYSFYYAVPADYSPGDPRPLLVSLTYSNGVPRLARGMYSRYWRKATAKGWIVLQLPTRDEVLFFRGGGGVILPAVRWALANLSVDARRVWLCGASNGGTGAFWFALRRGDLFGACVVYPGMLLEKAADPLGNLSHLAFLLWHGENDHPAWGKAESRAGAVLKKLGCPVKMATGEGMGHLPDPRSTVADDFIAFLEKHERDPAPASYTWCFHDPDFPAARDLEVLDGAFPLVCKVEREPGRIALTAPKAVKLRLCIAPSDLKDGKVTVTLNGAKVFEGAPPSDLASTLHALYRSVCGRPYRYSLVVGGK